MKRYPWLTLIVIIIAIIKPVKLENSTQLIKQYDPETILAQILGYNNSTSRQAGYGLVTFDGQPEPTDINQHLEQSGYGLIKFQESTAHQQNGLVAFEDQEQNYQNNQILPVKQKKRRRRKKPRFQQLPGQNYGFQQPGVQPGVPIGSFYGNQGPLSPNLHPQYKPYRRKKAQNLAEDALTAVTRALGSIALYDDYQCVPRLLCEVAGGRAPATSGSQTSSILPSFIDLQPLITLLAAYNGLSGSPLFVFGRAVFLGMASKGNSGSCSNAYPLCPTDPEKLVNYLNNHNGGFFRFFNGAPQPQIPPGYPGQQNLQQFYSHLSTIPGNPQDPNQYGLYKPQINQQNYGLQSTNAQYGLYNPGSNDNGISYPEGYGAGYPYQQMQYGYQQKNQKEEKEIDIDNNRIENRIQNKPSVFYVDTKTEGSEDTKWIFPERETSVQEASSNRVTKSLRFPIETQTQSYISYDEKKRQGKGFLFPGEQSNRKYVEYYNYPPLTMLPDGFDAAKIKFDGDGYYVDNDDVMGTDNNNDANEDGVQVIYVLRGNGDANNPEVVKLRPGQKIQ